MKSTVPLTLELPPRLGTALEHEAEQEGISAAEHATLLLSLVTALLEQEKSLPFQDAVETFLSRRLLIAGEVVTSDHHEFDPLVPLGLCPIKFIR